MVTQTGGAAAAETGTTPRHPDSLRELRKQRSLSLYDVAQATDLHFSTIGKYERGERRPSLETLRDLAELYRVDLAQLLELDGQDTHSPYIRLLNHRPELEGLLQAAERLTAAQVLLLTDFIRSFHSRA